MSRSCRKGVRARTLGALCLHALLELSWVRWALKLKHVAVLLL